MQINFGNAVTDDGLQGSSRLPVIKGHQSDMG